MARADFGPGQSRAVAVDVLGDAAVVLLVRLRRDGAWDLDLAQCLMEDGRWSDAGVSGGTYGDLPLEWSSDARPEIAVLTRSYWEVDDRAFACAGGIVAGPVHELAMASPHGSRRVRPEAMPRAFAVLIETPPGDVDRCRPFGPPPPDIRALDLNGEVVDDSALWRAEADAELAGTMSVQEALQAAPGTPVTVRGLLLVLPGEQPLLCDDVEPGLPPWPIGPTLVVPVPAGPPSWTLGSTGLSLNMAVATGVIRDGVLTFEEDSG